MEALIADMEALIADMKACQEVMEANPEKREPNPEKLEPNPEKMETNPVEMTSVAVHEEFRMGDAAVRSSGTMRKQHGMACGCKAAQGAKETDPRTLWIPGEVGCRLQEGVLPCKSHMAQERRHQKGLYRGQG
jgi:hypothetical protein